jgi:hypothetical protein
MNEEQLSSEALLEERIEKPNFSIARLPKLQGQLFSWADIEFAKTHRWVTVVKEIKYQTATYYGEVVINSLG